MPDKLVFIKTLTTETKGSNSWLKVIDQDNVSWNIFSKDTKLEYNKAYLFTYFMNEKGFDNVSKITPVTNIFHQKALKEVANRNDVVRNYSVAFSYAKDLSVADKIKLEEIFDWSDKIYNYFQEKADKILGVEKPDVQP